MELISIGTLAHRMGVDVQVIRRLADKGVIPTQLSPGGHRRFDPEVAVAAFLAHRARSMGQGTSPVADDTLAATGLIPGVQWPKPAVDETRALDGLEESQVWTQIAPRLGLSHDGAAYGVAQYAFTEMLNNAIDHSAGETVRIRVWRTDTRMLFEITDNGLGVFEHVATGLGLPGPLQAIAELTKGKVTTAEDAHSGEGIFFTSKAVEVFRLAANRLVWTVDNHRNDTAAGSSSLTVGTQVVFELDLTATTPLGEVAAQFTDDDYQFTRTTPKIVLFAQGVTFISRSEAKRVMAGMEKFTRVEIDFAGVTAVGQGFADEVFRVWPAHHPGVEVVPTNMSDEVEFWVLRAVPPEQRGWT